MTRKPKMSHLLGLLSDLDPAKTIKPLSEYQLNSAFKRVNSDDRIQSEAGNLSHIDFATSAHDKNGRRRILQVVASILVVLLGTAIVVYFSVKPSHRPPTGLVAIGSVPAQDTRIANQYVPLTSTAKVECGGISLPVALLAEPGEAQTDPGPAADALRKTLANNPFGQAGLLSPTDWVLISQTGSKAVYGQRTGAIGIGSVISFAKRGDTFVPISLTGCGTVQYSGNIQAEVITSAAPYGHTLVLDWVASSNCGDGPAKTARVIDHVEVLESETSVIALILSRPSADTGQIKGACAGTGVKLQVVAHLKAEIGDRTLFDAARVPERKVVIRH